MYTLFGGYLRYLYYDISKEQGEYPAIAWLRTTAILAIAIASIISAFIALVFLLKWVKYDPDNKITEAIFIAPLPFTLAILFFNKSLHKKIESEVRNSNGKNFKWSFRIFLWSSIVIGLYCLSLLSKL